MKSIRTLTVFFCVVCLLAVTAAGAGVQPDYGELVFAEGGELASTADGEEQQRIRTLLESVGRQKDLAEVTVDYPLDESLFPPDFFAPTFIWHDGAAEADRWLVEVVSPAAAKPIYLLVAGIPPVQGEIDPMALSSTNEVYQPTPYQASAVSWRPGPKVWEAIKRVSTPRPIQVTFFGYRADDPERVLSRGRTTFSTSTDPVGAPIFYRDVPLMPPPKSENSIMPLRKGAVPLIAWRLRDVSMPDSRMMLRDMPSCANCHSFSADGRTMGMDIDGPRGDKGAYAISPVAKNMLIKSDEVISWNSFKDKTRKTLGFMSRMSPDGKYAVTTLNEQIYVGNFPNYKFGQVFYPTRGILASYSQETGEMLALPGADNPEYVHVGPVWTPDGKTIVFARGRAREAYPKGRPAATYAGDPNETPMQYSLYRMPFNGGRGGKAEPIAGASNNGMSNSFAKVSPDGKWIVFVQASNGLLMRPDSKLWIVPAAGGKPRLMRCNTSLMNSWHSFSPDGRWMVFSSKSNTPYTQMFLTHIDEEGNDTPAILIENSTAANRAVNIPEFVNRRYDDFAGIYVEAVEHFRHQERGNALVREGRFEDAIAEFEKALEKETNESGIYVNLSLASMALGRHAVAQEHARNALEINPYNSEMHTNLGFLLARAGDAESVLTHLTAATRINPLHPLSWYNRATLYLQLNNHEHALEDYTEALRLYPRYADALNGRGVVWRAKGQTDNALDDFDRSIEIRPADDGARYLRAVTRVETGDLTGALDDLNTALEFASPGSPRRREIETLHRRVVAMLEQ